MSARTPFIPSISRPASRTAHHKDSTPAIATQDAQFSPVVSNPLHMSSLQLSSNKSSASSETDSSSSNNKPLNVKGLFKKPSGPGSHGLTMSARKANPNQIEKPNSDNDLSSFSTLTKARSIRRDKASTPSVLAPKPLNAVSASELLSSTSNSFKTPSTPASSAVTSLHIATEAHIPISDENSHPHQYKFGNAPPQRVMLHDEPARANLLPMAGLIPKHTNRDHASKKRGRAELEADDDLRESDLMYSNRMDPVPAKRYKTNTLESDYTEGRKNEAFIDEDIDSLSRRSFSPQPLSSPIDRPGSRHSHHADYQQQNSPSEYHTSPGQVFHRHDQRRNSHQQMFQELVVAGPSGRGGRMGPPSMSNGSNDVKSGATLDKLLGYRVDIYVDDHMKKYDQLTTKWKDATLEEWVKGSDDMMAKFSKVLEYVKNHMSTKLKLFATFDQRINAHNAVLNERAKLLEDVKGKLVTQSGNILG